MEELEDFLEQSPYVQKKMEESREEGLTEGLQKAFVAIVEGRFPPLVELAQKRVARVTKSDKLDLLVKQIATIPDETTALWLINIIAA
jgi:hypothetical protein